MTDYNDPTTALLDLDWLLDQASLFITANAVECELEARCQGTAPADIGTLWNHVRRYLACVSVEQNYDAYLDSMQRLELACHKEEAKRKLDRTIACLPLQATRQAA